ncbi:Death-associated protein kinase dapk-1 [Carex littledalei]|uniref:Death-associated protein kinase dapk-1 n=1 Tax=Carex littledalei TaxID=544730 RepID=A0A833QDR6_9POAL|nr:Death-associated protein kinase dapk-1 [Carex littledalei]
MANPYLSSPASDDAPTLLIDKNFMKKYEEIDSAIRNNKRGYLSELVKEKDPGPANLLKDSILSIVIAYEKSDLAIQLISEMSTESVMAANYDRDTALHIAAAKGDVRVVTALVNKNPRLLEARNRHMEIPLHKAALYGETDVFWTLVDKNSPVDARREDGATMLHCAVMGNAPVIPLEERCLKSVQGDEEELSRPSTKDEGPLFLLKLRKRFPPNYSTLFDILQFACIPVSPRIRYLQHMKEKHKQTMDLIDCLAEDLEFWDFSVNGRVPEGSMVSTSPPAMTPSQSFNHGDDADLTSTNSNRKGSKITRWDDSPLTFGAKMGLNEFVERILIVCPQSAAYLDAEGMNVLQVAIKHGHEKIVDIIESMTSGNNPILPSSLLSSIEKKTKNTILHFAAEKEVDTYQGYALQMKFELQWFERVKKLVPKDLEYSRNQNEKTAQELFTEKHKEMVKSGKEQLMEVGKTCSSLVAAVVFASSFSIPGDKDSHNNPIFVHKIAFKVFSHAYVLGLSCASTALVLFLSLLTSSYKEQDFRRALPTKYILANISFFFALVALLVSFSCNIYLNIYGGRKADTGDIAPMVCELTIFPAVCFLLLLSRSSSFGVATYLRRVLS